MFGRRLLNALVLTHQNLANSETCQKQSSGECSRGVLYTAQKKCLVAARQQGTEGVLYTYIGVGLSALLVSTGWAMREP